MACKPTRFPNGIEVGKCLTLKDGATVSTAENIVETTAPYTLDGTEDVVRIIGGGNVTFVAVGDAVKSVDIYADGGSVTPVFVSGETTNQPVITSGNAAEYTPFPVKNAWDAV